MQLVRNISINDEQHIRELLHEEILTNYINNFVISTKTKKKLKKRTIQF